MDYKRIYDSFIADRLSKQPSKPDYFERHHIVPRCMGGMDDVNNLINLTPEDHFFAHLLLAKIFGGTLWAPIAFMVNGQRKDYKPTISRNKYGWAKRAMAKAISGENARQYLPDLHNLVHRDGRTWVGTQLSMNLELGISRPTANSLIKGKIKEAKYWRLATTAPKDLSGKTHPMYKKDIFNFEHVDGRKFKGTQLDFVKFSKVSKSGACNLCNRKVATCLGWFLEGVSLPSIGRGSRWIKQKSDYEPPKKKVYALHPSSDFNLYDFEVISTGEIITETKTYIRNRFGLRSSEIATLFSRRQRQCRGIGLAGVVQKNKHISTLTDKLKIE